MMRNPLGAKAEWRGIDVAGLHLKSRPIDGASIQSRRRSRLQPAAAQAQLLQRFAQQHRSRLARPSRGILLLAAMNQSIQKCSRGDDDRRCADRAAIAQPDSTHDAVAGRTDVLSVRSGGSYCFQTPLFQIRSATSACLIFRFGCDSSTSRIFSR